MSNTLTDIASSVLDELSAVLSSAQIVTGERTQSNRRDQSEGTPSGEPLAVLFPASTEEVAAVVTIAAAHRIPIVPQGARTGLAGGGNAIEGALVLSTTKLKKILAVDVANQTATVQAGVRTIALARAAEAVDLFYPPDPGSWRASTIGGNVAT
ncbi:MAG: FAD-binding oxidoreductase, partial [Cryobacterium sp.]